MTSMNKISNDKMEDFGPLERRIERSNRRLRQDQERALEGVAPLFKREERRLQDKSRERALEGVAPLLKREERRAKKRLRDQREEGAFERGTHVRKRGTAFRENVVEYEVEILDPYSVWNQLRLTRGYVGDVLRFVIYADFESLLPSVDKGGSERVRPYQEHIACGFSYKVVCSFDEKYSRPIQGGRGKDAVHHFFTGVMEEANRCTKIMDKIKKPLVITPSDEDDFLCSEQCHICGKAYDEDSVRVRDHCHMTGRYRGSAHQSCNLNFKVTKKIPLVFHNLRGYDGHLIMQQITLLLR